ncbi:MAG: hypothetical protein AAFR96_07990 [Planctomycetota bacterium]
MRVPLLLLCAALAGCAAPPPEPLSRVDRESPAPSSAPPPSAVRSVEPWEFAGSTGQIIRTDSYKIFTTVTRPIVLRRLPGFLEATLTHYRTSLTTTPLPPPPVKLDTYVMRTRPEWASLTRALMRERAPVYLRIQRGGFAAAGRGVYRDLGDLNDTFNLAAHEGWHQYTQLTFKDRLPSYLEEGLGTYMEGFTWNQQRPDLPVFRPWANMERFRTLRAAAQAGRLLSLPELIRTTPQQLIQRDQDMALVWYAQVWALIHFLNQADDDAHRPGFERLLEAAAAGTLNAGTTRFQNLSQSTGRRTNANSLFARYLNASPAQLDQSYQRFIARITAPGTQSAIVAGVSPI